MRAIVTGSAGQLGRALLATVPAGVEVSGLDHANLDIADAASVARALREMRPDMVLNAAAFTDVQGAEDRPELARRCNTEGAAVLAQECEQRRCRLVQISTDFVFDGDHVRPYLPADPTAPLNVYGLSKLEGEQRVQAILGSQACILRTSWLYGAGGRNFVLRMLELMRTRKELQVVIDEVGAPTWTGSLAPVTWTIALGSWCGVYHWCDSGVTSRYDFAVAIAEEAVALGLLESLPTIAPITSVEFATRVQRPAYSVLDKRATEKELRVRAQHWRANLRTMLRSLKAAERA